MQVDFHLASVHGMLYTGGNVCFAPDGRTLYSPVQNHVASIHLQQGNNTTHTCSNSSIQCFDISNDGELLFAVGSRGLGIFYSIPARVCLDTVSFPPQCSVAVVKISPCGKYVAIALESTLQIYNTPAQRVVAFHSCHRIENAHNALTLPILSIEWTADSRHVMIAGQDARIRILPRDIRNAKGLARAQNHLIGHRSAVLKASFTDDEGRGAVSVSADNVIIQWKRTTVTRNELMETIGQSKLNARATDAATANADPEELLQESFIERRKKKELATTGVVVAQLEDTHLPDILRYSFEAVRRQLLQEKGVVTIADFHRARGLLAIGYSSGSFAIHAQTTLSEGAAAAAEYDLVHLLSISAQSLTACAFGPNGDHVAFGSAHLKQLMVWDWKAESYILKEQSHIYDVTVSALTSDGANLISGGDDGKVRVSKTSTGQCFVTFAEHSAGVTGIVTSPATNAFFTCSKDGTCRGFDLVRYRNFRVFAVDPPTQFSCLAIDPSGEILVVGSLRKNMIYVFSVQTGKIVDELTGHEAPIVCLAFHPDGTTCVSGSLDKNMIVWNMFTTSNQGERLRGDGESLTMQSEVLCVAYSATGSRMAVLCANGEITTYETVVPGEPMVIISFQTRFDATGGWSNTVGPNSANANMHFTSIDFSPDGEKIVAAGESKWICLYHATQGFVLKKWPVTTNLDVEGAEEQYKYRVQSEAGPVDDIDVDDEDIHLRQRKILEMPGSRHRHFSTGKRKTKLTARATHVRFAAHGREFCVASSDGLLVFSLDITKPKFNPLQLTRTVTIASVRNHLKEGNHVLAVVGALILQDEELGIEAMRATPSAAIPIVVGAVPTAAFPTFVVWIAHEVAGSRFIEHALKWAQGVLVFSSEPMQGHARDTALLPSLKTLHRAVHHHDQLVALASENADMLRYLAEAAAVPFPQTKPAIRRLETAEASH